jgi:hypothetical protein
MNSARSNQFTIIQGNHSSGDSVPLGKDVLSYTVKCHPLSAANLFIGINEDPSEGNLLQPGESMTVTAPANFVLDDIVYLNFDPTQTQGKAVVIITRDLQKEYCR